MKKVKVVLFLVFLMILGSRSVQASSGEAFFKVSDEASLKECFSSNNMCELSDNVDMTSKLTINDNVILDLKGYTISPKDSLVLHSGLITVGRGGKLTILDNKGTGKITTGPSGNVWAGIQLVNNNETDLPAELVVNGGTIEGYYYAITGNGNNHNSILTINGGTIKALNDEDSVAIYQPQNGKMEINSGVISGGTGIEIRSGDLTINGGTIKGVATSFVRTANKSGTTTNGAGVTVAQHTTKNPINVTINNGDISGQYAFYEWNPHKNAEIDKVKLWINGGDFKTVVNGGYAVYSEDFTNFINGGKFNSDVSKYLTNDAKTTSNVVVEAENKLEVNSNNAIWITLLIVGLLIVGFVFYKKIKNSII